MRLLKASCPITITRFVITIVITAVNRVLFRRTSAHVLDKQHKVIPSRANLDAPTAVVLKSGFLRVVTTISHIKPNMIKRVFFGYAVRGVVGSSNFPAKAPAARGMSTCQRVGGSLADISARTFAPLHHFASFVASGYAQDGQATEDLVDNIFEIRMSWKRLKDNAIFIVGHGVFSFVENQVIRLVRNALRSVRAAFILPQTMRISMGSMQMRAFQQA